MCGRIPAALLLFTIPAGAAPELFHEIRNKDEVTLVLPGGECGAKVVKRRLDQLTVRLKKTTGACGKGKSLAELSRADVVDVLVNRRRALHNPVGGAVAAVACGIPAAVLIGAPAFYGIYGATQSEAAALSALLGSEAAIAVLCHPHGPHYTVFTSRIVPDRQP